MTKANEVLKEIEELSRHEFLPIVGPRKGEILTKTIKRLKPKRILEVGTLIGYSAILMGKELDTDAEITTIEIHAKEAELAEHNIRRAQIPSKVRVIVGDALTVIPKLNDCYDMVFIDAEKTEYFEYLRMMKTKLHVGSVIVADNAGIFADQMRNYLDFVRSSGEFRSTYFQVGEDGVEVSFKL